MDQNRRNSSEAHYHRWHPEYHQQQHHHHERSFTWRAVLLGCLFGVLVCIANTYFGLQTGYSSAMTSTTSLLGFWALQFRERRDSVPARKAETVLIQTVATATGCFPATAGLLGAIPALEYLVPEDVGGPLEIPWPKLIVWCFGLAFFGLLWAMLLRKSLVDRSDLPWPGAKATAVLIHVLHGQGDARQRRTTGFEARDANELSHESPQRRESEETPWETQARLLLLSASLSACWGLVMYFVPILHHVPIFGTSASRLWLWDVSTSPGFFGTGLLIGPEITLHMLLGSVVGWAILSPLAKSKGWAPGPVSDWEHGSRGWIIWVSLSALLTDCLVKALWTLVKALDGLREMDANPNTYIRGSQPRADIALLSDPQVAGDEAPLLQVQSSAGDDTKLTRSASAWESGGWKWFSIPLLLASCVCALCTKVTFGGMVPLLALLLAILLSLPLSILGIRSLGETDYNPMSGIGKISQIAFAVVIPPTNKYRFVINIIAGAIAEAGASQAGDISYDLKVGQLVGANPSAQLYGQVIGSAFGAVLSAGIYKLYTNLYPVPGPVFQVPVSHVWIIAAKLATGVGLPPRSALFATATAAVFVLFVTTKTHFRGARWESCIPGGVAFAIGKARP